MTQIAIIFHRFGPYHRARIEASSTLLDVVGVELSRSTSEYAWDPVALGQCRHIVVCDFADSRSLTFKQLARLIDDQLTEISPQVVAVNGWSDKGALAALRWCVKRNVPAILMSESNQFDFARNPVREWAKRKLVDCFSAAVVGGTLARQYAENLGMRSERIFDGYDVIDNNHFSRPSCLTPESVRAQLNLPIPYFLASNRFIEKKNLSRLVKAFHEYRTGLSDCQSDSAWDLVLLGDGPLLKDITAQIHDMKMTDCVHLRGFLQYDQLPNYYWGAGAFVHASTIEQWGLVINEAMAAGLPVIASNRCGSVADLVVEGQTGFTFDPFAVSDLAFHMGQLSENEPLRRKMSIAAVQHIAQWGPERFAEAMLNASQKAISAPESPGYFSKLALQALCR